MKHASSILTSAVKERRVARARMAEAAMMGIDEFEIEYTRKVYEKACDLVTAFETFTTSDWENVEDAIDKALKRRQRIDAQVAKKAQA